MGGALAAATRAAMEASRQPQTSGIAHKGGTPTEDPLPVRPPSEPSYLDVHAATNVALEVKVKAEMTSQPRTSCTTAGRGITTLRNGGLIRSPPPPKPLDLGTHWWVVEAWAAKDGGSAPKGPGGVRAGVAIQKLGQSYDLTGHAQKCHFDFGSAWRRNRSKILPLELMF